MNIKLKPFVDDDNDIVVKDNIVQKISLLGGVRGTPVYHVDTSIIGIQKLINKKFTDTRIKKNRFTILFGMMKKLQLLKI